MESNHYFLTAGWDSQNVQMFSRNKQQRRNNTSVICTGQHAQQSSESIHANVHAMQLYKTTTQQFKKSNIFQYFMYKHSLICAQQKTVHKSETCTLQNTRHAATDVHTHVQHIGTAVDINSQHYCTQYYSVVSTLACKLLNAKSMICVIKQHTTSYLLTAQHYNEKTTNLWWNDGNVVPTSPNDSCSSQMKFITCSLWL